MAVRAPGAALEGVPAGVPGPGLDAGLASSVFRESGPGASAVAVSPAADTRGSGSEETCALGASGAASRVSITTVLPGTVGAGAAGWVGAGVGPRAQAGRASPGATRVTGDEVAVVTAGPGATTRKGPAREPRGGGEGAAGAP